MFSGSVQKQFKILIAGSCLGALIVSFFVWASLWILPSDDPYQLVRYFVIHIPITTAGILSIGAGLWFVDWVTPGDFLDGVTNGQVSCAILAGAIVLAIAGLLCWT